MKRFLIKSSIFFFPFLIICIYVYVYEQSEWTGDLGRLGKIPFGLLQPIVNNDTIDNYVINCNSIDEIKNAKNITIGDSFSQQDKGFQQFLGNTLKDTIYNIRFNNLDPEESALYLIENNYIPNCKNLIIESVERSCIRRLNAIQFNKCIYDSITVCKSNITTDKHKFMSLTDIASYIRLKFGYDCPFSIVELTKPLFSHPTFQSSLVFLNSKNDSDLSFINYDDSLYTKSIDNIIRLHTLAKQQNIDLIYLIAADKYDVYSEYIKNNPFPINQTLDKFKIDENWFINSKAIFQRHLQQGVKDIYYVNDTHWSPIGAQIVGEYIGNIIQNIHNNINTP